MASMYLMLYSFFFLQTFLTLIAANPQFPCFFIFGDSFVDNGNNNYLQTNAKADYLPYGIDFPIGPTGRFTNGRNFADIIAKQLGFKNSIPPFANGTTQQILGGLNYGSGGSGILNKTGSGVLSLSTQLSNHEITISRIKKLLQGKGKGATEKLLRSCLYYVGMGTNDYIENYLPQFYSSSADYTPQEFAALLISHYSNMLRRLHRNGARKVAVVELGKLGCIPLVVAMYGSLNSSSCVKTTNRIVQIFNQDLKLLINDLNRDYPTAKFVSARYTALTPSTDNNIKIESEACCVLTPMGVCVKGSVPCSNRDQYRFWDSIHPTEAAVAAAANNTYNDISPLFFLRPRIFLAIFSMLNTYF